MGKVNELFRGAENITAETPARSSGVADTDDFVGVLAKTPLKSNQTNGLIEGQFNETPSATLRTFTIENDGTVNGTGVAGTLDYDTGTLTLRATTGGQDVDDSTVALNYMGHDGPTYDDNSDPAPPYALGMADNALISQIIQTERLVDEEGIFQVEMIAGGAAPLRLWGRAHPSAPWFLIHTYVTADMGSNDTAAVVVAIFPEMYAEVAGVVGNASPAGPFGAWLVE